MLEEFKEHCRICMYQFTFILVSTIALIALLRTYKVMLRLMPIIAIFLVAGHLPVYPIYPDRFFILMATAQFGTIYFTAMFTCTNIIEAIPYYTINLLIWLAQIWRQFQFDHIDYRQIMSFWWIGLLTYFLLMSEFAYSIKEMFM